MGKELFAIDDCKISSHAAKEWLGTHKELETKQHKINAYIPDNQFRSRDPTFQNQKPTHGQRHQKTKQDRIRDVIPASGFHFDPVEMTCDCPAGNPFSLRSKEKVQSQWRLYRLVHTIEKLANYEAIAA